MDMNGVPLHRWQYNPPPDLSGVNVGLNRMQRSFIRRAQVFPNGDLLALFDRTTLVRLDKSSNVLWTWDENPHHAFDIDESGDIHVLATSERVVPRIHPRKLLWDDEIVVIDGQTGREKSRHSILDGLIQAEQEHLLEKIRGKLQSFGSQKGDILHTNHVERIDQRLAQRLPGQKAGNYLLSSRPLDTIFLLDPTTGRIDWTMEGEFEGQHHPTVVDDGKILLFDNGRTPQRGSRVLELIPESGRPSWELGQTPERVFFSSCCGTVYRLENGNTLAVETGGGRALEITRSGDVVWEFVNPHRAGPDDTLIAQLFDLIRLPGDFPLAWASAAPLSEPED